MSSDDDEYDALQQPSSEHMQRSWSKEEMVFLKEAVDDALGKVGGTTRADRIRWRPIFDAYKKQPFAQVRSMQSLRNKHKRWCPENAALKKPKLQRCRICGESRRGHFCRGKLPQERVDECGVPKSRKRKAEDVALDETAQDAYEQKQRNATIIASCGTAVEAIVCDCIDSVREEWGKERTVFDAIDNILVDSVAKILEEVKKSCANTSEATNE